MPKYSLQAGRCICRNDQPFVTLHGVGHPNIGGKGDGGTYDPIEVDAFAATVVEAMNAPQPQHRYPEAPLYCTPTNAGLQSEPRAVYRRVADLITTLDSFSWAICRGPILDDIKALRNKLMDGLQADGCFITYDGGDRMKVYEPDSKTGARKKAEQAARLTTP